MRIAAAAAAPLLLAGCLSLGSIETRGTNINESIGVMQNRAMLLNLVRASRSEPLYFTAINQVQAQGATDLKLTAPVVLTGQGLTAAARAFTWDSGGSTFLDNSTNTNFQMGVYSTQAFYSGMLAPLGLTEVDLLLHQGFPRELIFYLAIEKAKLTNVKTGQSIIVYNDPTNKASYGRFVAAIQSAMVHGLTTEVPQARETGEPAPAAAPGGRTEPVAIAVKPGPPPTPQLCFERALATEASKTEFAELVQEGKPPNFCGAGPRSRANSRLTVRLFGEDVEVEVTTRSIYGIFRYLGQVMAHAESTPQLVDYGVPSETTPAGPLLTVTAPATAGACFSAVRYEGQTYCIPLEGSQTSKDIFNVLSVLVALKQSPGDLPATATVLVAP
jgi:hypothetical protein